MPAVDQVGYAALSLLQAGISHGWDVTLNHSSPTWVNVKVKWHDAMEPNNMDSAIGMWTRDDDGRWSGDVMVRYLGRQSPVWRAVPLQVAIRVVCTGSMSAPAEGAIREALGETQ